MSFQFKCPHCQTELEAQDDWVGLETSCPQCQNILQVPSTPQISTPSVLESPSNLNTPPNPFSIIRIFRFKSLMTEKSVLKLTLGGIIALIIISLGMLFIGEKKIDQSKLVEFQGKMHIESVDGPLFSGMAYSLVSGSNKVQKTCQYKNGLKHGEYIYYDTENGNIGIREHYRHGELHGEYYRKNKWFTYRGQYVNGKKDGQWIEEKEVKGKIIALGGKYVNGEKDGLWKEWDILSPLINRYTQTPYMDGKQVGNPKVIYVD